MVPWLLATPKRRSKQQRVRRKCACGCGSDIFFSKRVAKSWLRRRPIFRSGHEVATKACPVCCEEHVPLDELLQLDCGCVACVMCVENWMVAKEDDSAVTAMRETTTLPSICCPSSSCASGQPQLSESILKQTPHGAARFADLQFVRQLKANSLYPASAQVACRDPKCVGLGYLGADTVMCFVCYDQYDASEATVVAADGTADVKRCPKCTVPVQKDGGCDMMVCGRCGHDYTWSGVAWSKIHTAPRTVTKKNRTAPARNSATKGKKARRK